ncbi:hypothetical protein M408DRAFT_233261 [Serendipita vermifera MAFF 305830]|uniref:Uncharacterized protein n=1 Tax=Serendipita vermifera MAFF 305830 TaxID=933852 RepID=A0A0C3AYP1_SERVB|nr:hypothetical protein M408DRAFT_233261 [Serendipita vermifera MAFF 305830]
MQRVAPLETNRHLIYGVASIARVAKKEKVEEADRPHHTSEHLMLTSRPTGFLSPIFISLTCNPTSSSSSMPNPSTPRSSSFSLSTIAVIRRPYTHQLSSLIPSP